MASASSTSSVSTTKRRQIVLATVLCAMALLTGCLRSTQSQVLNELNADRSANKLRTLPTQADAQAKAQAWAEKLARENTLYHSTLSQGIKVKWCSLGENVGYGPSVPAIEDAYMNSSGHRANILSSKWNGVGVGYATNGQRVFTVQVFIKTC
ncbi:MAG TPA: CAP domain-containing protein [Acidimicrobiales bacterium]|nr:CAP domain-containing protein [Acidimicrobiales bacterium]